LLRWEKSNILGIFEKFGSVGKILGAGERSAFMNHSDLENRVLRVMLGNRDVKTRELIRLTMVRVWLG